MSIQTESIEMGEPIDPATCQVMAFHKLFKNPNIKTLEEKYRNGEIGFGDSKKALFELVWEYFADARTKREKLESDPQLVDEYCRKGAEKAARIAYRKLEKMRNKMGLSTRSILS